MGNVEQGESKFFVQPKNIRAKLQAQLAIETGKGFVHEQSLGVKNKGSGKGDALLLSSRQFTRPGFGSVFKIDKTEHLMNPQRPLLLLNPPGFQTKFEVAAHREMRPQGKILKNKPEIPLLWLLDHTSSCRYDGLTHKDAARVGRAEACEKPENGCLAAA